MVRAQNVAPESASWWRSTWPLGVREFKILGVSLVAIVAVYTLVGFALVDWFAPNPVTRLDSDIAERLTFDRTEDRIAWANRTSLLSDTLTKIVATTLFVIAALIRWRRWHEAVLIALSLIFEATAYIIISHVVGRPRPGVPKLEESPVDASFPSGHVAAATVYLALAVVVAWHTRHRWLPAVSALIIILVVAAVGLARMYQGMHYLSDVVAGSVLGLITVAIVTMVVQPDVDRSHAEEPHTIDRSLHV